jgi:hypothetical protein
VWRFEKSVHWPGTFYVVYYLPTKVLLSACNGYQRRRYGDPPKGSFPGDRACAEVEYGRLCPYDLPV